MGPKSLKRSISNFHSFHFMMRKYQRLALFIIAFLSCSLMLMYQHRYSKLNVILQVMNAFSFKNNSNSVCNKRLQELSRSTRFDWMTHETSSGLPVWTEVFPKVYMYSSFWFGNTSNTLTFVDGLPDIESLTCQYHYDNGTSSYITTQNQLFRKKKGSLFFLVKCTSQHTQVPHSISFQLNKSPSLVSMPVFHKQSYLGMLSMCVEPLPVAFNDAYRTIEFLVYHHHLGISHFLIYDQGMSSTVKRVLLEFAPKSNIYVTLLPWNIPFSYKSASEHNSEYFVDCIHRVLSSNYSSYIVNGALHRYFVTKGARNLTLLLKDEKFNLDPPRFYEHTFCSEYEDDVIARNLNIPFITLLKDKIHSMELVTSAIYSVQQLLEVKDTSYFKVLLLKGFPQKSTVLPKHIALVHSYSNCNETLGSLEKSPAVDKYMWKYKNLFFKSKLYTMAKQQLLLSET